MKKITDRIPFDSWINSQLSIARFYGGIEVNGKKYIFDPEAKEEENGLIKPDLITYDE
jgi:hypothetical protein